MRKKETVVISLGGSLIVPEEVNIAFLKKFKRLILNFINKGNKVIIVCGGGKVCRRYNAAAKSVSRNISNTDLDWLGIAATKLNAELLRVIFSQQAYEKVLDNPSKKVKTNKRILIGSGYRPGSSSDKDAVLLANSYNASMVINLTNIDYVYNKNPKKFKNAKPLKNISWSQFRRIVGNRWDPGANVPFGPPAARLAQKIGLKVVIVNGARLSNLKKLLSEKRAKGTIIY